MYYQNTATRDLANVIRMKSPDIVGLCEFTASKDAMASDLTAATPGRSYQVQPGYANFQGYGTLIFFDNIRFEALEGGVQTVSCPGTAGGNRAANWVVLRDRVSRRSVITGGIHLSYCAGGCDATQECELGRLYDRLEAVKLRYPGVPVVWMGDLNLGRGYPIVRNLDSGRIGARSTFAVEDLAQVVGNTYYTGGSAIDNILGDRGVFQRISGGRTGQGIQRQLLAGADHFPVFATLQW